MNYLDIFLKEANKYPEFEEAKEIVKKNSQGNIWLIGGFIYRNIVAGLYGKEKPKIDLDFIVENPNESFDLPKDWIVSKSRMGSPKLIGPNYDIDFVPLNNIYSVKKFNLEPTLQTFLSTTPLNIQSIVYDINKNKLIGEKGIWAIENKLIIPTENKEIMDYVKEKKEMPFLNYLTKYANELGFDYFLPKK
ncbi:hypothetical protein GW932_00575 [archaeon]|nr:hypothetical protein [archaeon]